jgi:subfamily B ATP-binding cassette protein HlyB/CyaB
VFLKPVAASAGVDVRQDLADRHATDEPPVPPRRIALLVKAEDNRLLMFPAGTNEPQVIPESEFDAQYAGFALEAANAPESPADDIHSGKTPEFGFRWFYSELARLRKVWRDVLLASLFIQFIALATPLCSQVIIDKVIVHQTTSTLVVIASALAVFVLFGGALSWIRQYLVSHTGNRVDAVLGAAVFRHMMRLPLRSFEHRPTGVLAARLNGVETIREFLSGAAITLLLYLPFLLLFLALMFFYSVWLSLVTLASSLWWSV